MHCFAPRRTACLASGCSLPAAYSAVSATQASAAGETLSLVQNDAGAVVGHATNFTASGALNPDDTMFGFDIFIFLKNADADPTCAADFDSESANATHSGGNETWISPASGFQVGYGPDVQPAVQDHLHRPWQLPALRLRPGRLLHVRDRPAARDRRARSGDLRDARADPDARTGDSDCHDPRRQVPAIVRRPSITRKGHLLTCHPGTWSNTPTRLSYRWSVKGAAAPSPPRASSPFTARSRAATSYAA